MTRSIPLVYVAGRFSAPDREGVRRNIDAAEIVGIEVAWRGACPIVPHTNTSHPDFEKVQSYEWWIEATKEMARRCDAMMMVPGWEMSSGARGEKALYDSIGKPVFTMYVDLEDWLAERAASEAAREADPEAGAIGI
jgi:hypothetical protein